jgi:hypothetical protein
MPVANYEIGQSFDVQFAWKIPNGDYVRAVFRAAVEDLVPRADKYVVTLTELVAGRQESSEGEMRQAEERSAEYWLLVGQIVGRKVTLAFEADDGRALHLRLATLTGEHDFFNRFAMVEEALSKRRASTE